LIANLLFILVCTAFALLAFWVLIQMVFRGKWQYMIYFLLAFLPFYITTLSIVYQATENRDLVFFFQLFKDFMVIFAVFLMFLYQKRPLDIPLKLKAVDKLFLAFLFLGFVFLILPIGDATLSAKLIYFKNMLIPSMVYFLGRNTRFFYGEVRRVFNIVFFIAIAAFLVNVLEYVLGVHIQAYTGYALFNQGIYDIEPSGNYGLSWTFETQSMSRRLASFFSDPLELASSILLGFSAGLIWFLTSDKKYSFLSLVVIFTSVISLFFSSSRAAFGAFFILLFFLALVFKLYRLLSLGLLFLVMFSVYVLFFAPDSLYFFVLDTLTFQNASSVGHVIEWIRSIESIINHPFGIGLSMSGNLGTVSDESRVGGENQFLIYGVQLGVIGMLLYILLLFASIRSTLRVFRNTENLMTARVAFTAAAVKVGLLLPLFTANADLYAYVSWVSWWMVGYALNNEQLAEYEET
jgi:hypothetical protein